MDSKIVANKINKLAGDLVVANEDYVYDPNHTKKPHDGGNWHKTEKGWSRKERKTKGSELTPEQQKLIKLSSSEDPDDREKAAGDPNLPVEKLVELSKDKSFWVQEKAAENPNLPADRLNDLSKHEFWGVRYGVASNPNTPYTILRKMAQKDKDRSVKEKAESKLSSKKDEVLETAMASSEYTPEQKKLIQMARSFDPLGSMSFKGKYNRLSAAKSDELPLPFLVGLTDDEDREVQRHALKNPRMPEEILKKVAVENKERDFGPAEEACANPNLKDQDFLREASSFGRAAQLGVLKNPNTPEDVIEKFGRREKYSGDRAYAAQHPNASPKLLEDLSKDKEWQVREAVAGNKKTTKETLHDLIWDEHFAVRRAAAKNENTDPNDLDRLFWRDKTTTVLEAIADNPHTPGDVLKKLSQNNDSDVSRAALRNPSFPKDK